MKKLFIVLSIVAVSCVIVNAQSHSKNNSVARVAVEITKAFSSGSLKKLDSKRLLIGDLNLTIENSSGDIGSKEFEYKAFRSFAGLGKWLKKKEYQDGLPFRVDWPLTGCRNGHCTFFQDGGILHNHVYMTGVDFGYRNGRLYIRSVRLIYG